MRQTNADEIDWNERGREELEAALNNWPKWKPAKNLILFIGDGLGISTLTAARFFQAQHTESEGREEDAQLSWDSFPATGLVKVCADSLVLPPPQPQAPVYQGQPPHHINENN